ncbi:MAG: cyclomaltodextrinase C-terminal domain-containing protein [Clostridia bacterium]|nr:cyclomaltodextrinase C-terminal domain-containing protein [Clostridia bacterium]
MEIIDNKKLIPLYKPHCEVTLDDGFSPDWVKDLIITELRLATATKEGTIKAAYSLLNHYAQMGVNGLWLTPVYDMGITGNGYGSYGPYTIDPGLTGTDDYEKGWQILKEFIDEAHRLNIRIFLDAVTWGTVDEAPIREEHPEYYSGRDSWGGKAFQYGEYPWRQWYFNAMMKLVTEIGVDGFRCDCEPHISGYEVFKAVRDKSNELGYKIAIFSEDQNERLGTYDFEQFGVMQELYEWGVDKHVANPRNHYLEKYNIVDSVKTGSGIGSRFSHSWGNQGKHRFYSYNTCCHDNGKTVVDDNLLAIGYQAILAPFIPIMWTGDEVMRISHNANNCLYFFGPEIEELLERKENRAFFEKVKKLIRIRRTYPEIFSYFPANHRNSNICKVESDSDLQAYGRYADGKCIMVIPNNTDTEKTVTAKIPYGESGLNKGEQYSLYDLITDKELDFAEEISLNIPSKDMAVILIEKK